MKVDQLKAGDRVLYRVYPSGEPAPDVIGTVKAVAWVSRTISVYWDGIDQAKYPPTVYEPEDLAMADGEFIE